MKILKSIRFVKSFITGLGGIGVLLTKAISLLRNKGMNGVIEKSKYILKQTSAGGNYQINTNDYQKWVKQYSSITPENELAFRKELKNFESPVLISVLMPVYNTRPKWLKAAIESVRNQIYPHWELCIADDASNDAGLIAILKHFQSTDSRIKVCFRKENGHISEASNSALEMAGGDFIALLDHDDLLTKDALFWVAGAINKNPGACLIYSDEDKINSSGKRLDPYFKCDWNYSLFLSQNMVCHLGVYKTSIVKNIGGFRAGYEGSQDYDLALRFIEEIDHSKIFHVPRILYHWRVHRQSTARGSQNKPYALLAGQKAISEHLLRTGAAADVEILPIQLYRVKYRLPPTPPKVSIIIPTKNNLQLLHQCIESIFIKTTYPDFEVIVVNNQSDDPATIKYLDSLMENKKVRILDDARPFNFSAINNLAVKAAVGEYICFLNDDTEVINGDWLTEILSHALQRGVGAVGAKLWYPDRRLQHAGIILGLGGVAGHSHKYLEQGAYGYFGRAEIIQEFSAVTGACMLVSKSLFQQVGGFDEEHLPIAFNDVDLCLKIRVLGYRIVWTPYAELYHHESASRGDDFQSDKQKRFFDENAFMLKKWAQWLSHDPAYSLNLTREHENFDLAWPPRV